MPFAAALLILGHLAVTYAVRSVVPLALEGSPLDPIAERSSANMVVRHPRRFASSAPRLARPYSAAEVKTAERTEADS